MQRAKKFLFCTGYRKDKKNLLRRLNEIAVLMNLKLFWSPEDNHINISDTRRNKTLRHPCITHK